MTNEELVMKIKAGENVQQNMEQLHEQTKRFIRKIAWKYKQDNELEDLLQEGFLALYEAAEGYDPEAGLSFISYLALYLKTRFSRYLAGKGSCIQIPIHKREDIRKYQKFCSAYFLMHGCEPSVETISRNMQISMEQVEQIKEIACMARVGSLDKPVKDEEDGTVGEFLQNPIDHIESVEEQIHLEQLRETLWGCVDNLLDQQADVIRARYLDGCTFKEAGERFGITGDSAKQLEAKALRKLRMGENRKKLLPFYPEHDRIFSAGIVGIGLNNFNRTWTSATERVAISRAGKSEDVNCPTVD